jgi:hypothetical protein
VITINHMANGIVLLLMHTNYKCEWILSQIFTFIATKNPLK